MTGLSQAPCLTIDGPWCFFTTVSLYYWILTKIIETTSSLRQKSSSLVCMHILLPQQYHKVRSCVQCYYTTAIISEEKLWQN